MIQIANTSCIAYLEDGHICRKEASVLDLQRGGMVCLDHAATLPKAPSEDPIAEPESAATADESQREGQ